AHPPSPVGTVPPEVQDDPAVPPLPVPADRAPAARVERPVIGDPARRGGNDQTTSAIIHTLRGVSADTVIPGLQGTGIRALGLTGTSMLRFRWIPWQRIAGLVIPRLKV